MIKALVECGGRLIQFTVKYSEVCFQSLDWMEKRKKRIQQAVHFFNRTGWFSSEPPWYWGLDLWGCKCLNCECQWNRIKQDFWKVHKIKFKIFNATYNSNEYLLMYKSMMENDPNDNMTWNDLFLLYHVFSAQ